MVVRRTTTSVFLVVPRLFWLSRAHGQPNFRTLPISIDACLKRLCSKLKWDVILRWQDMRNETQRSTYFDQNLFVYAARSHKYGLSEYVMISVCVKKSVLRIRGSLNIHLKLQDCCYTSDIIPHISFFFFFFFK